MDGNQASPCCDNGAINANAGRPTIIQDLNDPWMEVFVMSGKYAKKEDDCILDDRPGTKRNIHMTGC